MGLVEHSRGDISVFLSNISRSITSGSVCVIFPPLLFLLFCRIALSVYADHNCFLANIVALRVYHAWDFKTCNQTP